MLDIAAFSEAAAEAVALDPRERLPSARLDFLRELEPTGLRAGIGLFHASPRDPVWEYVLSLEQAYACMEIQAESVGADRPLPRLAFLLASRRRLGCGDRRWADRRGRAACARPRGALVDQLSAFGMASIALSTRFETARLSS